MIADIDIWRTANLLLKHHGEDAVPVAVRRADDMIAAADLDGYLVWLAIVQAINELNRCEREQGETAN